MTAKSERNPNLFWVASLGVFFRLLLAVALTLGLWVVQDKLFAYFPFALSMVFSSVVAFMVFVVFGFWISGWLKDHVLIGVQEGKSEHFLATIEELNKKVLLLEQRILELKAENQVMKKSGPREVAAGPTSTHPVAPDAKQSIVVQQRVFLHDLASKLQILHGASSAALTLAKTMEHKDQQMLIKHLEMISRNLDKTFELHKANREFLIIAS